MSAIKIKCPWCRRLITPTKTGKIRGHKPNTRESTGEFLDSCAGSGRLPAEWNDLHPLRMTLTRVESTLNPGGPAAMAAGCTCSMLDNNRGRWAPIPPDSWLVALDCAMHRKRNS